MSSNSSACQGLDSFFNPIPPKPCSSFSWSGNQKGGSFLPALGNTSYDFKPFAKGSASSMSPRSLEMCTETLGNETGSSIDLNLDEYSYLLSEERNFSRTKPTKTRELKKKINHINNFPPPLSSISGNNGVNVQAHREGGRLKITASSFWCSRTHFNVERENGRLRLFLVKDDYVHSEQHFAEKAKDDGGKFSSRCNGDRSGSKKLPSLPVCVAIS